MSSMGKLKITVSIDESIVHIVDSKVDNKTLHSRSEAIEHFLRKGLTESIIDKAIIMIRADQHESILKNKFLKKQLEFLKKSNIRRIIITTQSSQYVSKIKKQIEDEGFELRIYENKSQNNSQAILAVKNEFTQDCLVISGDVLNDFNVQEMIKKHFELGRLVTMGIISKAQTETEGSVIVDGDYIIDFFEKSKKHVTNIVNAGIYVMKPEALTLLEGKQNIEYELFPKLAKLKQLIGYFIYGSYEHLR